ncbi:ribonuclease HII [Clostridium acetireducens DSM 10703]|uniref:Ribonuclease HII n=1 Tax=Clostridium acetireducens DSM 10703 TaxID=1121290 RepID=A0A1E8F226_9CLOT|nr:ribonuclease HII [Clostridium acetireducens]OFI07710.1 ribonuclease HII [Clostridium acetireducens DSM 10703]
MNIDNFNISEMTCKDIKVLVDSIDYNLINEKDLLYLIKVMNNDSRKNVKNLSLALHKRFHKHEKELQRVKDMYYFDERFQPYVYLAGADEVGRGPLAGPIVAAAVILRHSCNEDLILNIKDSKKLSSKVREELNYIILNKAVSYSLAIINNDVIDEKGISWANNEVLKRACLGLKIKPDIVLSDGYIVKNLNIRNEFILKGDARSASIASASIIAKVYRDNLMKEYSKIYPEYSFEKNVGYGTKEHIEAIKKYGYCKIHRLSFLKNIL